MKFKVIETFSGIGAQNTALKNLKSKGILDYEIIGTSDWDVFAAQSYAAIHYKNYRSKIKTPTDDELDNWIKKNTFSLDGSKPFLNTSTIKKEVKLDWYKAFKVASNIGTIVDSTTRIKKIIEDNNGVDLLTYSFPCTDLSTAGNFHGFNEGIKAHTRSGLLLEIEKVLINLKAIQEERERERERDAQIYYQNSSYLKMFLI